MPRAKQESFQERAVAYVTELDRHVVAALRDNPEGYALNLSAPDLDYVLAVAMLRLSGLRTVSIRGVPTKVQVGVVQTQTRMEPEVLHVQAELALHAPVSGVFLEFAYALRTDPQQPGRLVLENGALQAYREKAGFFAKTAIAASGVDVRAFLTSLLAQPSEALEESLNSVYPKEVMPVGVDIQLLSSRVVAHLSTR